jgi:anti-sigma factor RsiW
MPRPAAGGVPVAVLRRQWTRAVHAVAAQPRHDGDVTFESRAEIVTGIVPTVQPEPPIPGTTECVQALSPVSQASRPRRAP